MLSFIAILLLATTLGAADGPDIVWTKPTNGFSVGLVCYTNRPSDMCVLYVKLPSKYQNELVSPDAEQLFRAFLFDSHNKEIDKTQMGSAQGKKLDVNLDRWNIIRKQIIQYHDDLNQIGHFQPKQLFHIKTPGIYKLKVEVRLLLLETNVLKPLVFDSLVTEIKVR